MSSLVYQGFLILFASLGFLVFVGYVYVTFGERKLKKQRERILEIQEEIDVHIKMYYPEIYVRKSKIFYK